MNSTTEAAGKGCGAVIVFLILALILMYAGADMIVQHECHELGYDTGGLEWSDGVRAYCEYLPLRVPLEELLKGAYYVPSEGTAS